MFVLQRNLSEVNRVDLPGETFPINVREFVPERKQMILTKRCRARKEFVFHSVVF
jgi:hypothetical protein